MRHLPIKNQLFKDNRRRLAELLEPQSLAVVNANDVLPTNADGSFIIHPNADLFYLTGIEQEESILVLFPDAPDPKHREILFLREPSEHLRIWEGFKHSKEDAKQISGVDSVHWISEFPVLFKILMFEAKKAYLNNNEHNRAPDEVETRERRFINQVQRDFPLHEIDRLAPLLHELRFVKDPLEIKMIKEAVEVTNRGFRKVLRMIKPGVKEFEIEGEYSREFIRRRCKFAYSPIIASGANACTLHYLQNDQECKKGEMLLMDVGACYGNYNADLTRTVPVSGKFNRRQKQVYKAVLRVLRQCIENATVGKAHKDWQNDSHEMMTEEMLRLKLITPAEVKKQDPASPACRKYFMHGLGHPMGLDVHDVNSGQHFFKENAVYTVEPGIYIPEEGLGVRLEDDIVITADGPVNLMAKTPIEPDEIEQIMNR
ncbi:MAG: aminopeptidase P family protein [Opitutae bacterium]|nr:aminopeptidase P family protein [Opitutae bacterium]